MRNLISWSMFPARWIETRCHRIKPLRVEVYGGEGQAFQLDIEKLIAFREIGYRGAFLIAFGESVDRIREYAHDLRQSGIDLNGIELSHHRRAEESATPAEWYSATVTVRPNQAQGIQGRLFCREWS